MDQPTHTYRAALYSKGAFSIICTYH